jgi:predicted component of type VI protein secretion system
MSISILMLIARIALALCLYGFLALVLLALWRDLHAARSDSPVQNPRESVRWLGPENVPQHTFALRKESNLIGRSPTVEITLPNETVSAVHARVWKSNTRWWLEDLDSRNGTFLNEIPVDKSAILCPGDRIRIGRCVLEFISSEPAPAPCTPPAGDTAPPETTPTREIP